MSRNRIEQHPDEYRADLNPDYTAGENAGLPRYRMGSAHAVKEIHERYPGLRDDELNEIPILEEGSRLEQGAVYLDLRHPERGVFKAMGDMVAGPDNWFVPKSEVSYELWNFLSGVEDAYRLGDKFAEHDEEDAPQVAGASAA